MGKHDGYMPHDSWGDARDPKGNHGRHCVNRGYVTEKTRKPCLGCVSSNAKLERRFKALMNSVSITRQPIMCGDKVIPLNAIAGYESHELTFVCPLTGVRVSIEDGQADRPLEGENGGAYRPDNVCMISSHANLYRRYARMDHDGYRATVKRVAELHPTPSATRELKGKEWKRAMRGKAAPRANEGEMARWVALIESGRFGI